MPKLFLLSVEFGISLLIILFIFTQIFVPVFNDEKIFPIFRKKWRILNKIYSVREKIEVKKVEKKLKSENNKLNNL